MANTEALNYKVSPELKQRIEAYAQRAGLSMADACRVLHDKALTAEGIPPK